MTLPIRARYLDAIARGDKTVEGRLDGPRFAGLAPGDTLLLQAVDTDPARTLRCAVLRVRRFADFEAMLRAVGVGAALPGVEGLAQGVAIYRAFPGYDQDRRHGVIAIDVRPM